MAAASSSSVPVGPTRQLTTPEYSNWLALGHALTTILCQGLRPFISQEMETLYKNVTARVAALSAGPCTCLYVSSRKPNQFHDMKTCAWAGILKTLHHKNSPKWKQSDSSKWMDPNIGPWEIAKLYLPDLSRHTTVKSAEEMDITGILNLMYWCKQFTVPQPLVDAVRETRNTKWAHVPKLELTDVEKRAAFNAIENLLQNSQLARDPDAQKALQEILKLKCVTDLQTFEAQVLIQHREVTEKDISSLKNELNTLKKESKRNKKQRSHLEGRLRNMQMILENVNSRMKAKITLSSVIKNGVSCTWDFVIKCSRVVKGTMLTPWLIILLLCGCFTILDHKSYKDGCPTEEGRVPFETKEINMSEYLNTARAENFMGRQWLYHEVEDIFKVNQDTTGVVIIGDPGTGKSALSSQLVCSRTSSPVLHAHILGYHLCKHSDKNTKMAGKFVRNLAEMIARRILEYGFLVSNNSYIQRSFDRDCIQNQDPVGCFEQTILTPLRNLENEPKENWYIVIDALDECLSQGEMGHSVVYILNNKIPRFPVWLKLIMTSRNESDASLHSSKIKEFMIDPEDPRNLQDIELFLTSRFYQGGPLLNRIKAWFGDDSVQSTEKLVSLLLRKSQGNFLFVKEVLHHWELSRHELGDGYRLPTNLGDIYHSYFERLFPDTKKASFDSARRILELLVVTFEPLTPKEVFNVLRMREKNLEEEYEFQSRLRRLGHFVRYGKNNTITLYHLSLTDWLTSDSNKKFHVSKKKGHEALCEYYFSLIRTGDESTLLQYILNLALHIAYSGWKEAYVQEFLHFPSQTVNSSDPQTNRTLLHLAATINNTDVLKLVLRHFTSVDPVDKRGISPAFLAAEYGLVDNLALLVQKGAKINRKTNSFIAMYKQDTRAAMKQGKFTNSSIYVEMPLSQSRYRFFNATLLHTASLGGHINVVRFLLDNSAFISTFNGARQTALQLAAESGHVDVVKALYEAGAVADQTALHHAAANNDSDVVKFLLDIGVKDTCLRCDGSFYWLRVKRRLQTNSTFSFPVKDNCLPDTDNFHLSVFESCIDWERNWEELESVRELFDDKHLILCHTALHAAAESGHDNIVSLLLAEEINALHCYDYTGRRPLHSAVVKNHAKLVDILLEKQPQMVHHKCDHWQDVGTQIAPGIFLTSDLLSIEETINYHTDICHCGYTPLHLAARYGHERIGISLIFKRGARADSKDCNGATPFHIAACHNRQGFVSIFSNREVQGDINSKTLNGSSPLHSAAACGAVEVMGYMIYQKANLTAVDDYGLTPLHYSILNINSSQLDQVLVNDSVSKECPTVVKIDRRGLLAKYFKEGYYVKNTLSFRWLDTFIELIFRGSDINAVDINGRTALHIAAHNGLADVVNILLQRNATLEKRDKQRKTPLEVAIENATIVHKQLPFVLVTEMKELRGALCDHEMIVYLLLLSGASFNKCKRSGSSLLHRAIINQQPYSVQLLLMNGASLTCKDRFGRTPLVTYLHNGGEWTDVVLKHFNASITIKCGKPFNVSEFHLLSYRSPYSADDNFFVDKKCDGSGKCYHPEDELQKGSLTKAIESHPLRHKVINSCLDAQGFTPLHRAAQGANEVAIRYLLANGADDSILSPHGYDALSLAVLHAGSNFWRLYGLKNSEGHLAGVMQASNAAIELLRYAIKDRGYRVKCDASEQGLTIYHLAASRGLVNFVEELLKEKQHHKLDVDCPNVDGITPMYLAMLFGNKVEKDMYNPWEQVVKIIKRHGGTIRYPNKEAELNVIFNRIYGWIPNNFVLDLRPDLRHFIKSLLHLYEQSEKVSFRCSTYGPEENRTRSVFRLFSIMKKIENKIGREYCLEEYEQFDKSLTRALNYHKKYPARDLKRRNWESFSKAQLNWIQRHLLILMQTRHKEIFRSFACVKPLFWTIRQLWIDKELTELIQQYVQSPPLFYLEMICVDFKVSFHEYLLHHLSSIPFDCCTGYPDFLKERLTIFTGNCAIQEVTVTSLFECDWSLDFFVKLSIGSFRRYNYLKTLQVGLEQSTRVSLYTDKVRQALSLRGGHKKLI